MNIRSKVFSSVRWLFIAQLASQLIRIGVTIFVIRQLNPEHMAFVAISQSIIGFLEMFTKLGFNAAIIAGHDLTKRDIANISGFIVTTNVTLAIITVLLSGPLASFYGIPELGPIFIVLAAGFIFSAIGSVSYALLVKKMAFKQIGIIQVAASFVGAMTSYICAINGLQYWSLILGGLAIIGTRSLLQLYFSGEYFLPRFSFTESRQHFSFGGKMMLSGMCWYLFVSLDVIIAGIFWAPEILGIYAVAVQLVALPINRMAPLLKQVALPAFSETVKTEKEKLQPYLAKSTSMVAAVCFPIYFGISSIAMILVPVVLGDTWLDVIIPLTILSLALPFRFFMEVFNPAVVASGKPFVLLTNHFAILVIMVSAFSVVTSLRESPVLLSVAWAALFPILTLWACRRSCVAMEVPFRIVLRAISRALINSSIMWVLVFSFVYFGMVYFKGGVVLGAGIILGILIYLLLIYIFDRELLVNFSSYIGR